jgi:predicted branched-subunit amino acid permease
MRGVIEAPSISVVVIITMFIGFGALARDVGLSIFQAVFVSSTVFALPGQVVLADQIAQGATMAAAFFAVTLTAIRLLPLTASLLPHMRDGVSPGWSFYALSHIIAVTTWIESMRRLPPLPVELRVPYFAGFGSVLFCSNMVATIFGYLIASSVPTALAAALIFLTPIYFFLSLISASRDLSDAIALPCGFIMGPLIFLVAPGFDLVITGLVGGTLAYGILRWHEGRS